MSADLATWLLEQVAEDEKMARGYERVPVDSVIDYLVESGPYWLVMSAPRVLAECEAKRRIIEAHGSFEAVRVKEPDLAVRLTAAGSAAGLEIALKYLALPYADRPGYQEKWRPNA